MTKLIPALNDNNIHELATPEVLLENTKVTGKINQIQSKVLNYFENLKDFM